MGFFRFRKSIKILPGLKLNLNKKGVSMTAGGRGFHCTVGKNRVNTTIGLPGTGLSYTHSEKLSSPAGENDLIGNTASLRRSPKVCPYCGHHMRKQWQFCPKCHGPLLLTEEQQQQLIQQQQNAIAEQQLTEERIPEKATQGSGCLTSCLGFIIILGLICCI